MTRGLGQGRFLFLVLCLSACATPLSAQPGTGGLEATMTVPDPMEVARAEISRAIDGFRSVADLPDIPLRFVEMGTMINSPNGSLVVAVYADDQGRRFMVDPSTSEVVEMDARARLTAIASDRDELSMPALREKAERIAGAAVQGFDGLREELSYEEGTKGDLHFFDWRSQASSQWINPPFVQVGLHASGELFAFYDTLGLK